MMMMTEGVKAVVIRAYYPFRQLNDALIAFSPFKLDVSYQLDVQAPPDRGPPEKEITFDPSYSQSM